MTLGQKLKALLKEKNMTQEELAEQLDVSRQAVGKWVTDKGIPEVGKLVQISNMFGASLDYLLKEDGRENPAAESGYYVSGEMLEGYLSYHKQNRKRVIGGIILLMLANIFDELGRGSVRGVMEGLYWIVTLLGVALLVWQYFQTRKYREIRTEKLVFDAKIYENFKERRERERKKYAVMMIFGIVLLVVASDGITYLLQQTAFRRFGISPAPFAWIFDATGLACILWAAMSAQAESVIVKNTEDTPGKGAARFKWVYWAIPVTAVAVLIGVVSHIWSPMTPLIALLCALLVTICKLLLEKREER